MNSNIIIKEILKFVLVGCVAAFIQYLCYFLLLNYFPYRVAFIIGFFVSVLFNYVASISFTFHTHGSVIKAGSFFCGHLFNFALQALFLEMLSLKLNYNYAMIGSMAMAFPINFIIIRFVLKSDMNKVISIFRLLRVEQWIKNVFVFLPIFFDRKIFDLNFFIPVAWTTLMFSFASSSIYILNDIIDVEADKKHPTKYQRPIAAGEINIQVACGLIAVCLFFASLIGIFAHISLAASCVVISYFVLQVAYTAYLKSFAIIDCAIIAVGFVLRVYAGGVASDVDVSNWIIVMTFLITLFMAFAKRRDDVLLLIKSGGVKPRHNTDRYSIDFLNVTLGLLCSITIVSYLMYCFTPEVIERYGTDNIYLTSLFVLLAMLHYIQLAIVDNKSASPTKILLYDRFIQIMIVLFVISFTVIIYVQ